MSGRGVAGFEELVAWQRARALTAAIYSTTSDGPFSRDWGLKDQIRRAAVSVMSNIAEGYERRSPSDFAHFLVYALASCAEVRSQLFVALDAGYIDDSTFRNLSDKAREVSRITSALEASINRKHLRTVTP